MPTTSKRPASERVPAKPASGPAGGAAQQRVGSTQRPRSLARRLRLRVLRALALILALAVVLPPVLLGLYRLVPPPITPLMVMRVLEGEGLSKRWAPLDAISPHLAHAVIAAEDNLFCDHLGFDWASLGGEFRALRDGRPARGASTISMQASKNLFLWPGRSLVRKGLEAYLTLHLELFLDKRRIIEVYLNVAEMGPGIYGAEAAAQAYFGKSASELSRREATLIAAVLPNPRRWSPARPTAYIDGRARTLMTRIDQIRPLLHCIE